MVTESLLANVRAKVNLISIFGDKKDIAKCILASFVFFPCINLHLLYEVFVALSLKLHWFK